MYFPVDIYYNSKLLCKIYNESCSNSKEKLIIRIKKTDQMWCQFDWLKTAAIAINFKAESEKQNDLVMSFNRSKCNQSFYSVKLYYGKEPMAASNFSVCKLCNFPAFWYLMVNGSGFSYLVEFMESGPVVAMELKGANAITKWRTLLGPTDSATARIQAPLSIRAKFGTGMYSVMW